MRTIDTNLRRVFSVLAVCMLALLCVASTGTTVSITVPTTVDATGAGTAVSQFEPANRTFVYTGTVGDHVQVMGSIDGTNFAPIPGVYLLGAADTITISDRSTHYAAKRKAGTTAATLKVVGGDFTSPSQSPTYSRSFALQGAAAAIAETHVASIPAAQTLTALRIRPDAALTANDTNFDTITVSTRDASGGSKTTLGSITTKTSGAAGGTGNWTAFVDVTIAITGSAVLSAGMEIVVEAALGGSGVALPGMTVRAETRQP
jgi:hypothetical protein